MSEQTRRSSGRSTPATTVVVDGTSVEISHPDKVLWPAAGITKRELVEYYVRLAPLVLPLLQRRPLTLKPYPRGIDRPAFFLRTRPAGAPDWLPCAPYRLKTDDEETCPIVAGDARTLAWCANFNAVELHPWLSRLPDLDHPDLLMFDLDPGRELAFSDVLRVAAALRRALDGHRLTGFPKSSGKRGVHVLVPIERGPSFEAVRAFCARVGEALRAELPDLVTLDYRVADRPGKELVDYSQNSVAKSTVAPYSVRPVPDARVSTPLTWDEVDSRKVDPSAFTLRTIFDRIERAGNLIEGLDDAPRPLP